ncbi:hypothetical protein [Aquipuribacter hungaricus]|uniref:Uncharacterized protein n=1 Tax=Aquipuribacter hungaricus TaxID=545624 RepID=A0ABV7WHR5_9MICO
MLRLLRGRGPDGGLSPAARLVALFVVLGMLAVAAPSVFVALGWLADVL